jgi:hypothetical protein
LALLSSLRPGKNSHKGIDLKAFLKKTLYSFLENINNLVDYRLDKILNYRLEKKKFFRKKGYYPDLRAPHSFCEKVVWKKLNDRNPLLPLTADKYRVRLYLKEILGEAKARDITVPLLYVTDRPETIPFQDLPGSYIIKPNHASGLFIIVDGVRPDFDNIIAECKKWLAEIYGLKKSEWAYYRIKPKIIIEELLIGKAGHIPEDYKFIVFGGKCCFIYVASGRFEDNGLKISFFNTDWTYLNVQFHHPIGPPVGKPANLDEMIRLAEELAKPFDFVRVDLYSIENKIYFGELTHYPISGMARIDPAEFDYELGSYWDIKPRYWLSR